MQVCFATGKLMKELGQCATCVRRFGPKAAARIDMRLQQLWAAPTLAHMRNMPGRCHELAGDLKGHLAIDVHHPYRLLFRPTTVFTSHYVHGLDWHSVDSITIVDIVDYH